MADDGFGGTTRWSFVLIATYGRSGSTVVQALLASIPGWCIRGENYDALSGLYESYAAARRTQAEFGDRETPFDNPWHGSDEIRLSHYGRRLADAFKEEVLAPPAGTRVVGFKEIRTFHRIDRVEDVLDFASEFMEPIRIVFVQRDWREVSRSSWWNAVVPDDVREHVERCDKIMITYAQQHPARCFVVEHHRLEPGSDHLDDLFDFLGERLDPVVAASVLSKRLRHGKRSGRLANAGRISKDEMMGPRDHVDRPRGRLLRVGRWLISIDWDRLESSHDL